MIKEAFDKGVLDLKVHNRLASDIYTYAERAGIPAEIICTHLREYVGEDERRWARDLLKNRKSLPVGMAYVGPWSNAGKRMAGIAGFLVRNFVDARMMTVHRVIEQDPSCSVLLIPNFYLAKGSLPDWKVSQVVDVVLSRNYAGKCTILYVADLGAMAGEYGRVVGDLVNDQFTVFTP